MPLLNTEVAEKAGVSEVPTDWDAYISALDKFKSAGQLPDRPGAADHHICR